MQYTKGRLTFIVKGRFFIRPFSLLYQMKALHMVAFILLVIGGLNWGLQLFGYEVGATFLGGMDSTPAKAVYALVALSAVFELATHKSRCKECNSGSSAL